jgi:hypothetical protein
VAGLQELSANNSKKAPSTRHCQQYVIERFRKFVASHATWHTYVDNEFEPATCACQSGLTLFMHYVTDMIFL